MSIPFTFGTIIDTVLDQLSTGSISDSNPLQKLEALKPPKTFLNAQMEHLQSLTLPSLFQLLGGVFVVGAAANTGRVVLMRTAAERIIARLRQKLFDNIVKQDLSFHDANRSGELISRLSTDTLVVGKTLTQNVSDGLRSLVMSVTGLGAMLYVNVDLTLTIMTIVPPVAMAAVFYGRYVRQLSTDTTDATAAITQFAQEKIGSIRVVRAFSQETNEIGLYKTKVDHVYRLGVREGVASGLFFGGAGLSGNLIMLAILYYGGMMVQSGAISVGDLTSFFLYTAYVGTSVIGLSSWYSELNKGAGASTRLFGLLNQKPQIETIVENSAANQGIVLQDKVRGKITFEDVHFQYPTRSDVRILSGLTLTVTPGETVAITGHSGSGKSTVAQLLFRFYDPVTGTIKIDDVDIKSLDLSWLRNSVLALVPQEPTLFAASIAENIRYGKPDATDAQVIDAAKKSNAHDFITSFPNGYDTFVGEKGGSLSGGQKQRIAIARAILKNPSVLVLDEATSALDTASENLVQEALDRLIQGKTVIVIAHRLSTIQKADRIVVLANGRVVESGTYSELLAIDSGAFRKLVDQQKSES